MKVDDRKGPQEARLSGPGAIQPAAGAAGPSGTPATDHVSVSDTARRLAQLRAELGDVSVETIREAKVQGLRAVMAKGQYSADIEDVARKLLRDVVGGLLG